MTETTGNRCGHDPSAIRLCDVVQRRHKKGRKGQPQELGVISAYLNDAATKRNRLNSWQKLNSSGRRRRTEATENLSVMQYIVANDFQLINRRCARRDGDAVYAPNHELIAKEISQSPAWKGKPPISVTRVRTIIKEFETVGYVTLAKQHHHRKTTGEWFASPRVITFTKKFFIELGGKNLWRKILKAGTDRTDALREELNNCGAALNAYFKLDCVLAPWHKSIKRMVYTPPDGATS